VKPTLPFIPGHEAIGLVAAVGSGMKIVKEGDRVGVPWLYSACGHCEYCLTGWETVCAQAQFGGYSVNGGFAEFIIADQITLPTCPRPNSCGGRAVDLRGNHDLQRIKQTETRPGEWIAISGAGGLGHLAIQYAKAMGLLVCAIDI
jgi:propanol-preferring alcohol dehydrogenase